MKQTAVDWLINEIDNEYPEINIRKKEWMVDKAKELEKNQIKEAFLIEFRLHQNLAEQYYKETYEQE